MKIVEFTENHLDEAGKITLALWGGEVECIPPSLRPLMYQYLARYYFHPSSGLNFAAVDEEGFAGMILGAPATYPYVNHADGWIKERIDKKHLPLFHEYREYLETNRLHERSCSRDEDAHLLLFASVRKGCGRLLLEHFSRACLEKDLRSILLWTDETCDFAYYAKHGFIEAAHFMPGPSLGGLSLSTWLFRKNLK